MRRFIERGLAARFDVRPCIINGVKHLSYYSQVPFEERGDSDRRPPEPSGHTLCHRLITPDATFPDRVVRRAATCQGCYGEARVNNLVVRDEVRFAGPPLVDGPRDRLSAEKQAEYRRLYIEATGRAPFRYDDEDTVILLGGGTNGDGIVSE